MSTPVGEPVYTLTCGHMVNRPRSRLYPIYAGISRIECYSCARVRKVTGEITAEVPVSGRDQPHPEPVPSSFRHDVRFEAVELAIGGVYIRAYCKPCKWTVALDNGHTAHDFVRLELQHLGVTA